ncbi:hypothetical protein [Streptomyces sp. NPDC058412]|uniref:hypothetical protein n=1 Tax=Streptomyces sp. NPDC058412 TaxID=3346486 RepID=UPI00365921E2
MRGPDRWLRRTSRGLLCACACLSLGAAGHIAAGGRLPGAGDLALVFAGLTVLGTLLFGGRRRRFDVTTLVLGATQFVLHLAFHRLSMPGGSPLPAMASVSDGMGGRQAMADHAPPGAHEAMSAAAMTHPGSGHAMTTTMTLAHALATFGTVLCVVYGERVLRRLGSLLRPRLRLRRAAPLPVPAERRLPLPDAPLHVRPDVLLTRCRPRRGPPPVMSA